MTYQVDITDPALVDAEDYVHFIRKVRREPQVAERWFRGLVSAIYSLENLPERCVLIPEADEFAIAIRHLMYFSHRIIFSVDMPRRRVIVYRVFHGARTELRSGDLAF